MSYGLNTLGPLCLWQCLYWVMVISQCISAISGVNLEPHGDASWLETDGSLVPPRFQASKLLPSSLVAPSLLQASSKLDPDCNLTAFRCRCYAKEREATKLETLRIRKIAIGLLAPQGAPYAIVYKYIQYILHSKFLRFSLRLTQLSHH